MAKAKSTTDESCTGATDVQTVEDTSGADGEDTSGADGEDTSASEEIPTQLIAVHEILFESHLYKPGDALPTHNLAMNAAWVDAGTAEWRKVEVSKALKAIPASATAGLPGRAIPSSEESLIGRVPGRGRK